MFPELDLKFPHPVIHVLQTLLALAGQDQATLETLQSGFQVHLFPGLEPLDNLLEFLEGLPETLGLGRALGLGRTLFLGCHKSTVSLSGSSLPETFPDLGGQAALG